MELGEIIVITTNLTATGLIGEVKQIREANSITEIVFLKPFLVYKIPIPKLPGQEKRPVVYETRMTPLVSDNALVSDEIIIPIGSIIYYFYPQKDSLDRYRAARAGILPPVGAPGEPMPLIPSEGRLPQ